MNWHARYLQQANWTRTLRSYLFHKAGIDRAKRVLEVGCGTGAVLAEITSPAARHGLDLDPAALDQCRIHASAAELTRGDALSLPYSDGSFDIVFCHFLLLWVRDPLQAVCEMARVGKTVIACAEPDHGQRVDGPPELEKLGRLQTESLRRQGADPTFGARLAETFHRAGIHIREAGPIQSQETMRSAAEWEQEWEVLESDLAGIVSGEEIRRLKSIESRARGQGRRVMHIPTYFAWGKT
jgi:ubiquinone/menaquinone biosynthesis C-methylase UbiE